MVHFWKARWKAFLMTVLSTQTNENCRSYTMVFAMAGISCVYVYMYVQDGEARSPQQLGIIPQTETCSDDLNKTQLLVHVPADCTFFLSMMFVRNAESHSTGPSEYALEGEACSWQRLGVLAPTEAYSGGLDESQRLVYVPKSSHLSGRVRQKRWSLHYL